MEVRVVFSDSEFESVQKCASEEGEDVSAFIRGATLELVKDIEDFKAFKEDMEKNPEKYSKTYSMTVMRWALCRIISRSIPMSIS